MLGIVAARGGFEVGLERCGSADEGVDDGGAGFEIIGGEGGAEAGAFIGVGLDGENANPPAGGEGEDGEEAHVGAEIDHRGVVWDGEEIVEVGVADPDFTDAGEDLFAGEGCPGVAQPGVEGAVAEGGVGGLEIAGAAAGLEVENNRQEPAERHDGAADPA